MWKFWELRKVFLTFNLALTVGAVGETLIHAWQSQGPEAKHTISSARKHDVEGVGWLRGWG